MATITFNNYNVTLKLRNKRELKKLINSIFEEEKTKAESVSFIFCNDEYLLKLNLQYLNHNTYTDILTFPLSEENEPIVAEIYISTERTQENAKLHGTTESHELHRVIIHGILHLCSYNDDTVENVKKMRAREDYYLEKICFT